MSHPRKTVTPDTLSALRKALNKAIDPTNQSNQYKLRKLFLGSDRVNKSRERLLNSAQLVRGIAQSEELSHTAQLQCARLIANLSQLAYHGAWISSLSETETGPSGSDQGRCNVMDLAFRWIALPFQNAKTTVRGPGQDQNRDRDLCLLLQSAALQAIANL